MKSKIMFASVLAGLLAIPLAANAQGIPDGIQHGASVGSETAGPVGAVVGGAYPAPAPVIYPEHRSQAGHPGVRVGADVKTRLRA